MGIVQVAQCSDGRVPERRDGLIERELPDALILYDPHADRVFLLNCVSAAIWDLCDGECSQEQIAEEIAQQFAAPPDEVLEDVERTITRFRQDGLLRNRLG